MRCPFDLTVERLWAGTSTGTNLPSSLVRDCSHLTPRRFEIHLSIIQALV